MLEHKFILVRDLSVFGQAPSVTGFCGMDSPLRVMRKGLPALIVRIADNVIIASTGEDASALVQWAKTNPLHVKNPIEKDVSKSSSQEKVNDFDPPVRTGVTLTTERRPDISHFEDGRTLSPYGFVAKRNMLRQDGWKLNDHAGHGNNTCNTCNQRLMIDLYFVKGDLLDPAHEELCFELCLNCGYAVEQIAIYLELENV